MKFRRFAALILFVVIVVDSAFSLTQQFSAPEDPKRAEPVNLGEQAPDFTLEDIKGAEVTLSSARGKMPTVLVFFRGYWCPFCARQLAELRSLLKPNQQVRLLAVSVDDHEKSKQLADKIALDGRGPVTYSLLSDPDHKVIDAYGLHDPAYKGKKFDGIPHPAVYVIDKNGRVTWVKVESDYKVRPSNEDIRAALASLH